MCIIYTTTILFVLSLLLIIKGGDWFVDAAAAIAHFYKIPQFIIGATIVSLATTLPELTVSIIATHDGNYAIATGNAIGSVTANTGLILALVSIFAPSRAGKASVGIKYFTLTIALFLLSLSGINGKLTLVSSLLILSVFAINMFQNLSEAKKSLTVCLAETSTVSARDKRIVLIKFASGLACIIGGADLLVESGNEIAHLLGVPDRIIGVTLIAIGTSLPELVTAISALIKNKAQLSFGNIIGANIIDITLILPICSFLTGKEGLIISPLCAHIDIPICLLLISILLLPAAMKGKFTRNSGILAITLYLLYIYYICMHA